MGVEGEERMSIPSYADLRRAVSDAATDLPHPTKGDGHRYGRVVYFDGGHVGARIGGSHWIAEGGDHQDSILALAHFIGATPLDPKVTVRKVAETQFVARCRGE